MRPTTTLNCVLFLLALAAVAATAAEDDGPVRDLAFGGDVRLRGYDLENQFDSDDCAEGDHYRAMRLRTRIWATVALEHDVTGEIRLANQNWGEGVTYPPGDAGDRWEVDNKSNKIFVDTAWLEAGRLLGLPVALRLGRQALMYGSGFVLFDGQSQFASTSVYLDGARLRVTPGEAWTGDLFWVKDQENARDEAAHDDLTLSGAYLTHRSAWAEGTEEAYVLRREDQLLGKDVWLFGARAAHTYTWGLDYSLEGGLQRGDATRELSHEAWGVKTEAGFRPDGLPWAPRLFGGWVGLSGDDPATADVNERWDVFYGGWPQYGDLMVWTFVNVGPGNNIAGYDPGYADLSSVPGEAVYANFLMPFAGLELRPHASLDVRLSWAPVRVHRPAAGVSDDFGDYWQASAKLRYSRQLSFGLYAGLIQPGAAFGPGADPQREFYWEAELRF